MEKGELGHLTNEVKRMATDNPNMKAWRSKNSMIIVWLINSMELEIGKPFLFLPTTNDIYLDLANLSQIFRLKSKFWQSKQGDHEATKYSTTK